MDRFKEMQDARVYYLKSGQLEDYKGIYEKGINEFRILFEEELV
jgi:hypothetical protein